ncbi:hypothetical protein GCM10022219_20720 [Microbacterium oryzae]|uniref:Uncharacterized protein n=1 Tax=Microbacterium oryzae TaxID=743009 RepID=A0A6I6E0L8_9MICO|nr:hypothetical protein D7D94_08375 [Microbacterium oryzae]
MPAPLRVAERVGDAPQDDPRLQLALVPICPPHCIETPRGMTQADPVEQLHLEAGSLQLTRQIPVRPDAVPWIFSLR